MGWFEIGQRERYVKCRRQVHAKEMCMEERDHDVGGGVGGAAKAVCINELVRGGLEARCVGVKRKKMRRILTKL